MMQKIKLALLVVSITVFTSLKAQEIPVPTGLKAEYISKGNLNYVRLSWDKKAEGDTLTQGYQIMTNFPPKEKMLIIGKAGTVFLNIYDYQIKSRYSAKYRFAVVGVNNYPTTTRSASSEVVEVITPSSKLPYIQFKEIKNDGNTITATWDYKHNIADMAGFKIYVNGDLLIDQQQLDNSTSEYTWELEKAGSYVFQISAVTENGIESRLSQKRLIVVNE